MKISVVKLKEILIKYMLDNNMTKVEFSSKFDIKYSTLLDITNLKRKYVSDFILIKLKDIIEQHEKRMIPEEIINNTNLINIINILPDETRGFIMYFLLQCLGTKKSKHVLDMAFSMLEDNKKAAFEYQLYELARDILKNKEQELMPNIDAATKDYLEIELKKLNL